MNLPAQRPPSAAAAPHPGKRAYRPPAPKRKAPRPLPTPTPTPTRTNSVPPPPSQLQQQQQQVYPPHPVPHHGMHQPQQHTYHPGEVEFRHSQLPTAASPPPFPDSQSQRHDTYPAWQSQYSPPYHPIQNQNHNQNGPGVEWPRITDSYRPLGFPPNCGGVPGRPNHTPTSNTNHLMRNDSGVLVPATQSTAATSSANAYRPTPSQQQAKVPVSEKVMAAVGQLEARVQQLSEDIRGFRDGLHDVRVGLQALPTKEEAKDDLRDMLSPALHEFFANLTASMQHMLSPLPEVTAQLTADKARDMMVVHEATPAPPVPHSAPEAAAAAAAATAGLVEHLVASLRPVDELKNAIHDMKDLPEALQTIGVFHRSIELLHHKLDQAQEREARPPPPPPPPLPLAQDTSAAPLAQIAETLALIESRMHAMEERLDKHDGAEAAAVEAAEQRSKAMADVVDGIAQDVAAFRASSFLTDRLEQRLPELAGAVAAMRAEAGGVQSMRAATERAEAERDERERVDVEHAERVRVEAQRLQAELVEAERAPPQQLTFAPTPDTSSGGRKRAAPTNRRTTERHLELHPPPRRVGVRGTRSPSTPTTYTKPPRSRSTSTAATELLPPDDLLPTPQSRHASLPPSSPEPEPEFEPELEDFTETLYVLQGAAPLHPARQRQRVRVEWQVDAPAFVGTNAAHSHHHQKAPAAARKKKSTVQRTKSDDDIVILGFAPPPPSESEDENEYEYEYEMEVEPAAAPLEETPPPQRSSTPPPEVFEPEPQPEPQPEPELVAPAPPKPARTRKRKASAKPAAPRKAGRSHKWTGARETIFTGDPSASSLADVVQVKTEPGVHLTRSTRRLLGVTPDAPS